MQTTADDDSTNSAVQVPDNPSTVMVDALDEGAYTTPLTEQQIWLCYTVDDGRKIPCEPRGDGRIVSVDPTLDAGCKKYATYYEALRAVKASKSDGDFDSCLDGVGVSLGELENGRTLAGFDIDDAIVDGEIEQWARTLVEEMDTYVEASPSHTGLHVLFYGELSDELKDRTGISEETEAHLEAYSEDRYFTFTGRKLAGAPETVEPREDVASAFHEAWFDACDDDTTAQVHIDETDREPTRSELTEEDAKVLAHIRACYDGDSTFDDLWNGQITGYESQSEADLALLRILSYHCRKSGTNRAQVKRLFESSGLVRDKWHNRQDYRRMTLDKAHFNSFSD